jgi:hypothetical protein
VVAVVVDDHHVALLALTLDGRSTDDGEATLHAVEALDGLADDVERHLELVGHRDDRERVEHVVVTGHAH